MRQFAILAMLGFLGCNGMSAGMDTVTVMANEDGMACISHEVDASAVCSSPVAQYPEANAPTVQMDGETCAFAEHGSRCVLTYLR